MTSAEKEVGIIAKLVTANENLQAAIDAQQVKLDKYRSEDFESRFYEACEAVAKEKVRNAILQGENKALKSKRIAEGRPEIVEASEHVKKAIQYFEHAIKKVGEYDAGPEASPTTEGEVMLRHAIVSLQLGVDHYSKAFAVFL